MKWALAVHQDDKGGGCQETRGGWERPAKTRDPGCRMEITEAVETTGRTQVATANGDGGDQTH